MKRSLPFVIIAVVALLTVGIATMIYRTKMQPVPAAAVAATLTPADEKEDPSLHARGPRTAPVTLEIYGDFQCPSCALASQAIDELQKQYAGKLRVIFHQFPLAMHKHALEAAMAAEAAGLQSKFWEMHEMLYQYQPVWSTATNAGYFFEAYAGQIGLNVEQFRADRKSPEVRARVIADGEAGTARGVKNTPTLFLNGNEVRAGFTKEKLQAVIETALAAKKGS
jgi:protein-disulfide isomerase